MPTPRQRLIQTEDGSYDLVPGHHLPGHTVDDLLEAGDIAGAKAELESLIDEGTDSEEEDVEFNDAYIESMLAQAKQRIAART
jgi:hypothetical protein